MTHLMTHLEPHNVRRNKILDSENIDDDVQNMIVSQVKKLVISEYTKDPNLDKKNLYIS